MDLDPHLSAHKIRSGFTWVWLVTGLAWVTNLFVHFGNDSHSLSIFGALRLYGYMEMNHRSLLCLVARDWSERRSGFHGQF